jgi:hypothetical protein
MNFSAETIEAARPFVSCVKSGDERGRACRLAPCWGRPGYRPAGAVRCRVGRLRDYRRCLSARNIMGLRRGF